MNLYLIPIMLTAVFLLVGCAADELETPTNDTVPDVTVPDAPEEPNTAPTIPEGEAYATSFSDGVLTYAVRVTTPTPCHTLSADELILESDPPQVEIEISIDDPEPGRMCAQVLDDKTYTGRITTGSEPGRVTITTPQDTYEVTLS